MSDVEKRLREARPNSQQYALGSNILLEAAEHISLLEARIKRLVKAGDDLADSIAILGQRSHQRAAIMKWDKAAINDLGSTQQSQAASDE